MVYLTLLRHRWRDSLLQKKAKVSKYWNWTGLDWTVLETCMLYHIWYTYWYTYWKLWLHLAYNLFEYRGLLWWEGVCMSSSWILKLSFRGVLKRKPCPCWYFTIVSAQDLRLSLLVTPHVVCRHFSRLWSLSQGPDVACRILPNQGLRTDTRMTSRENCVVCFEQYGAQFCAYLYIFRDYYKLNKWRPPKD